MARKINDADLQKVVDYLSFKPYREVFELLNTLLKLEEIKEPEVKKENSK